MTDIALHAGNKYLVLFYFLLVHVLIELCDVVMARLWGVFLIIFFALDRYWVSAMFLKRNFLNFFLLTLSKVIVSVAEQHAYHAVRLYKMMPSMAEFTVEIVFFFTQSICTSFYLNQHQIQMLSQKFLLRGLISHHLSLNPPISLCLSLHLF